MIELLGASQKRARENQVIVERPENNDCWNVAMALACNLPYERIRLHAKKAHKIARQGGGNHRWQISYLEDKGYERYKTPCKTLKTFLSDTEHTNYEYIVSSKSHTVYCRKGKVFDSNRAECIHIYYVMRRKISVRRKSIHGIY